MAENNAVVGVHNPTPRQKRSSKRTITPNNVSHRQPAYVVRVQQRLTA